MWRGGEKERRSIALRCCSTPAHVFVRCRRSTRSSPFEPPSPGQEGRNISRFRGRIRSGDDTLKQVEEEYPSAGRGGLPVKDVGRLLLRCADRPGLVAAVSAFLADAGANIVSLDQHATEQSGGTFMQRTIFNLPGLTAARDALEQDFREQVASRFDMDFRLTEAAKPKRVAIMASKED